MDNRYNGRNSDGTFAVGNPGKPKGARNKVTTAMNALLEGEADSITRKVIELALKGDVSALRLCLDRLLPPLKSAPVRFDIPKPSGVADLAEVSSSIIVEVSQGNLTPFDGTQVMHMVEAYRKTLEVLDIENRVAKLEKKECH